ncbi:glycerophosphodiester phosphodiesterase [Desertibacillus haloalkaliphilus]|uniref:glycerophosphodiester phosphodiesterase n=1 Tax=Desertibacillus haloalkaliphilus TaxID=1328930 RepID=UPI001C2593CC|nr:glycerophosphodiester phosphodiesterase [Desertibacillus haloalkaliphilus]MBU8905361.1 glycerophosphodiester phosphodiesterase [Desertibacillus haloalkaliphilus]
MLIIGHQGAAGLTRGNTLESFQKAIALNIDMVELDVRKTSDGELVVFHDPAVDGVNLTELTYQQLNERTNNHGFTVPRLDEVVRQCQGKIKLDVELKESGYEEEVIERVAKAFSYDDFLLTSFSDASIKACKEKNPKVKTGLIVGKRYEKNQLNQLVADLFPTRRLLDANADVICVNYRLLRASFLRRMKRIGVGVYVWTVDDKRRMMQIANRQVDGLITDYPDRACELFGC